MRYQIKEVHFSHIRIVTHFWETMGGTKLSPWAPRKTEPEEVTMARCNSATCVEIDEEHTHDPIGVRTHVFPDGTRDEDDLEEEECDLMMMDQEQPTPGSGPNKEWALQTKYVVVKATQTKQVLVTPYWGTATCRRANCPYDRQHQHYYFDPEVEPKEVRTVTMEYCQDMACQYAPELHAHQGNDSRLMELTIPRDAAICLYGTDNPNMNDLPKNDQEETQ